MRSRGHSSNGMGCFARSATSMPTSGREFRAPPSVLENDRVARQGGVRMATMYLMNLEDRVELARNQLDFVITRLQSVNGQTRLDEIEHVVRLATTHLLRISEMIGR